MFETTRLLRRTTRITSFLMSLVYSEDGCNKAIEMIKEILGREGVDTAAVTIVTQEMLSSDSSTRPVAGIQSGQVTAMAPGLQSEEEIMDATTLQSIADRINEKADKVRPVTYRTADYEHTRPTLVLLNASCLLFLTLSLICHRWWVLSVNLQLGGCGARIRSRKVEHLRPSMSRTRQPQTPQM